jgi:hypothetical protein
MCGRYELTLKARMEHRQRRFSIVLLTAICIVGGSLYASLRQQTAHQLPPPSPNPSISSNSPDLAINKLETLPVKGRAPKTGYSREQFAPGWADIGSCTMRDYILKRDMSGVVTKSPTDCTVESGALNDPYTGKVIHFQRGAGTSTAIQIDHVVALSNAWQTGAQQIDISKRAEMYNDPLELLAVDGPTNDKKGDGDAATWLPPNKAYRCRYVARQIAVKIKYSLWLTQAEHDAIKNVLQTCPAQNLPTVE